MADPSSSSAQTAAAAVALSDHLDTRTAAREVADVLREALDGPADLVLAFASYHHASAMERAAETLRQTIEPQTFLACTAESVLGDGQELEGRAGLSAIGLRLPNVTLHPFVSTPEDPIRISQPETIPERIGLGEDHRLTLMLADPFSTPLRRLLPVIDDVTGERPVCMAGGVASGGTRPGVNALVCDDQLHRAGAVGVSLAGELRADCVVSQGCRAIGEPLVITKGRGNVILELGGRRAFDALQDIGQRLSARERELLSRGLLLGRVLEENKTHFGRGDFLVRNVIGFDQRVGGIAIAEEVKLGRTVQFHVRDAETATEDLQLLLDAQMLDTRPLAGLLFTCNGRGSRLFDQPNHDVSLIDSRFPSMPLSGFFAAGELGPLHGRTYVHAHTASLVLLRA